MITTSLVVQAIGLIATIQGALGFLASITSPRDNRCSFVNGVKLSSTAFPDKCSIDPTREIFCNTELTGASIEAVGFDMDYTLAQYNDLFEVLSFEAAKKKLLQRGYPSDALKFDYCPSAIRRGLIIDQLRGNIIKIDRNKYVRKGFHGSKELTSLERKQMYTGMFHTFSEPNFVNIDTLFQLVDASLFSGLVDYRDRNPLLLPKSYDKMFSDIKQCVSECHMDGSIKGVVMQDPAPYLQIDNGLVAMLNAYRESGKKVFLLTNSLWDYTDAIMSHLLGVTGSAWQSFFDIVIVGACKPAFLTDQNLPMFRVCPETGKLSNIEHKQKLNSANFNMHESRSINNANTFQGGNWEDLHRMLHIRGEKILYIGDHIFADILRSKKSLGWRTCFIIPELEREISILKTDKSLQSIEKLSVTLRSEQRCLDEHIDTMHNRLQTVSRGPDLDLQTKDAILVELHALKEKQELLKARIRHTFEEYESKFNSRWGQLFKAGYQYSRFAKQVMDYACLYTSRATNLGLVWPNRSFRPLPDSSLHTACM